MIWVINVIGIIQSSNQMCMWQTAILLFNHVKQIGWFMTIKIFPFHMFIFICSSLDLKTAAVTSGQSNAVCPSNNCETISGRFEEIRP
jgi:hypothetical protein